MKRLEEQGGTQSGRRPGRRRRSLARSIRRLVLLSIFVIFVVSSLLSGFFAVNEIGAAVNLSGDVVAGMTYWRISEIEGLEEYVKNVLETYRSIPENVRTEPHSEAYRGYFRQFEDDPITARLQEVLVRQRTGYILEAICLAMYDPDNSALVYIADSVQREGEAKNEVGNWESVGSDEIEMFRKWAGEFAASSKETSPTEGTAETPSTEGTVKIPAAEEAGYVPAADGTDYVPQPGGNAALESVDRLFEYADRKSEGYGRLATVGYPVRDSSGDLQFFIMVDIPILVSRITAIFYVAGYLFILFLITLLLVLICRRYVRRRLTRPIRQITESAQQYVHDRMNGDTCTDHFDSLNIRTKDELEDLTVVMSEMEHDIGRYERDLMKATAEQQRIQTELSLAASIQDRMLPTDFPAFPERTEFEIFASMDPAKGVGGDFYDFFLIDEDHLALVIADVSGKGVPAALFMMTSKIILNNFASMGLSPKDILTQANEKICALNLRNMFVTVWLGILDLKTGQVIAGNAGHEYPVIRQSGGKFELMHDHHNLVIGAMSGMKYGEYTFTLEPGSTLFLYTDGVPEANITEDNMYGTDRLVEALNRADSYDPTVLLPAIRRDVDAFVNNEPQFDDLTMLSVYYKGPAQ